MLRIYMKITNQAGKGRKGRKEFDQMLKDAARKQFDVVVFWALDRFSRQGFRKTFEYLQILDDNGIAFPISAGRIFQHG